MLRVNNLVLPGKRRTVLGPALSLSGATKIGDMTSGGGLAEGFDGDTSVAGTSCAQRLAANPYIGAQISPAKRLYQCIAYGANNQGFNNSANIAMTIELYGKAGSAPASGTDGTSLGLVSFTDTNDESAGRTILVGQEFQHLFWDYAWIYFIGDGSSDAWRVAEVVLYEGI